MQESELMKALRSTYITETNWVESEWLNVKFGGIYGNHRNLKG
jgi:hypothetical protein